jgi:hypothetical protein
LKQFYEHFFKEKGLLEQKNSHVHMLFLVF